jgi:hypothetical protein
VKCVVIVDRRCMFFAVEKHATLLNYIFGTCE